MTDPRRRAARRIRRRRPGHHARGASERGVRPCAPRANGPASPPTARRTRPPTHWVSAATQLGGPGRAVLHELHAQVSAVLFTTLAQPVLRQPGQNGPGTDPPRARLPAHWQFQRRTRCRAAPSVELCARRVDGVLVVACGSDLGYLRARSRHARRRRVDGLLRRCPSMPVVTANARVPRRRSRSSSERIAFVGDTVPNTSSERSAGTSALDLSGSGR